MDQGGRSTGGEEWNPEGSEGEVDLFIDEPEMDMRDRGESRVI